MQADLDMKRRYDMTITSMLCYLHDSITDLCQVEYMMLLQKWI